MPRQLHGPLYAVNTKASCITCVDPHSSGCDEAVKCTMTFALCMTIVSPPGNSKRLCQTLYCKAFLYSS